jgi:hypothetical protein
MAQIRHESAAVAALQNPHSTHDGHSLSLNQSSGRAFVNDHEIGPQRPGQEDGGEFSSTQRMSRAQCRQTGRIGRGMNFNPVCSIHRIGGRPACAAHDDFLTHLAGNMDATEKLLQQIEAANAGKGDERGRVGNDDHSLRRSAVARSAAKSASV